MASARAMIPYINVPDMRLGPLPVHPFGVLVATGVFVGTAITMRRARKIGYDPVELNSFITWMLIAGFVLSHILDSFFYHWDEMARLPWSLNPLSNTMPWFAIEPWLGLSSFGGFIGALIGIILWKYFTLEGGPLHKRAAPMSIFAYADLVCSVLPIGWMFGRAGCASVHDHKGARAAADTLVAVTYPLRVGPEVVEKHVFGFIKLAYRSFPDEAITDVGFLRFVHGRDPRFDLGLLELMFTIVLAACFAVTWRRRLPLGSYIVAISLSYAPVRFVMDYFRVGVNEDGDTRYGGLTPAQWSCIALFVFGFAVLRYMRTHKPVVPALVEKAPPAPDRDVAPEAAAP